MKESLYELSDQLNNVLWMMAQAQDVESPDVIMDEALKQIELDHTDKVCDVGCAVKNIAAEADALGAEIKRLTDRKRSKDNLVVRLKDYILANVDTEKKYEDARVRISFRKSERVTANIDDISQEFVRVKKEIDKTALKKALKAGAVPGATLEAVKSVVLK